MRMESCAAVVGGGWMGGCRGLMVMAEEKEPERGVGGLAWCEHGEGDGSNAMGKL